MANPNPNEPNFPYSGGTDNPGDNTAIAGGGVKPGTSTGRPDMSGLALSAGVERFPPVVAGLAQAGHDTILPSGVQAVPPVAAGFESTVDRGADPEGGTDPIQGTPREAGQDETQGATETTSGAAPSAFPEPNP